MKEEHLSLRLIGRRIDGLATRLDDLRAVRDRHGRKVRGVRARAEDLDEIRELRRRLAFLESVREALLRGYSNADN
jgi:hypothetical protein